MTHNTSKSKIKELLVWKWKGKLCGVVWKVSEGEINTNSLCYLCSQRKNRKQYSQM